MVTPLVITKHASELPMRKERPGSSGSSPGIKKVVNILTNGKNIAVNADQNISIKELIANKDGASTENKPSFFKLAFDGGAAADAANNIKQKNFATAPAWFAWP